MGITPEQLKSFGNMPAVAALSSHSAAAMQQAMQRQQAALGAHLMVDPHQYAAAAQQALLNGGNLFPGAPPAALFPGTAADGSPLMYAASPYGPGAEYHPAAHAYHHAYALGSPLVNFNAAAAHAAAAAAAVANGTSPMDSTNGGLQYSS